jgi:transcriptional regulator GlxA family with amidase domain
MQHVHFLILPDVQILDVAGPIQAFHEANAYGADYRMRMCGLEPRVRSDQGLWMSDLEPLAEVGGDDVVVVSGVRLATLDRSGVPGAAREWLRTAYARGALVCSVCTGAFVLADAGLLDGRQCTTHWSRVDELARRAPRARVLTNRIFVEDSGVVTSAGIVSGVDMALALVERRHGPHVASAVAREMVVYLRRDGAHDQRSVYLDYRTHLHPGVHRVQDWILAHPSARATLAELAALAGMSARNLTRVFRGATGVSVGEFVAEARLELARDLLHDPGLTVEAVAERCGFDSARQLRRLWKRAAGTTPSSGRSPRAGAERKKAPSRTGARASLVMKLP